MKSLVLVGAAGIIVSVVTTIGMETELEVSNVNSEFSENRVEFYEENINYFDDSENAFIAAYRHHPKNNTDFEIMVEYFASPAMKGKTLLLADPMLATGQSLIAVYEAIKKQRTINQVHIISIIGSSEGIKNIKDHFPVNTQLWIAAIDDQLNDKGYIVPGLGDAGDLAFGIKL